MCCGPIDECLSVIGDRSGRRIVHMLEDRIEHRPGVLRQSSHKRNEFAVEVAHKQQRLLAQHRETRGVNRADRVLRLEQRRHQRWKDLGYRFCVGR